MTHHPDNPAREGPRILRHLRAYSYLFLSLHLPAIALGFGMGVTTPALPVLAESFGVSVGVAALVFVVNMAGGLAASVPAGYVVDRFGRRGVLFAGPLLVAVSAFLIATADSFLVLLVYRFIGGIGLQMWTVSRLSVIADTGRGNQRGKQVTSMFGVQRIGQLSGPAVGGFAAAAWGTGFPFIIQGVVTALAVIPSFFVVKETGPAHVVSSHPAGGRKPDEQAYSWRSLLVPPIPVLFSAQYLATLTRGAAVAGGGPIFLFAVYAYGSGPETLGILGSTMAAVGIPFTLAAGFLMDRFGRKALVVPGQALLGLAYVLMAATAFASLPFAVFVLAFVWIQVLDSLLSGSWQVIGADLAPRNARGRFFATGRLVSQAGFMSNPLSFSLLTAVSGFTLAFGFFAATGLASAVVLGVFVKETVGRSRSPDAEVAAPRRP